MILIYVPEINERINYTFSFVFEHILGISIQLTDSVPFFSEQKTPKISYSDQAVENEPHFPSCNLLFENDIKEQEVTHLLQDPFAICFYLLSRYEEYLSFKKDSHHRFSYDSFSLKGKIDITIPWIDYFAFDVFHKLKKHYPILEKKERKFRFINTLDVDHAWLYKNKPCLKNTKSLLKKLIKFEWREILYQISILLNRQPDPYFIYPYIEHLQLPTIYFISYGKGKNKWDTNHKPDNPNYQLLVKELDKNPLNTIGLHPSYNSNTQLSILEEEKSGLEKLLDKKITRSRQHFIKIKLPETYTNLINLDIKEDFSMGFQDHIGFRAGTCTPFYWFDLTQNKVTHLKIYPFCVMDVTLKNYMKLSVEEAKDKITELVRSVKKVQGTFISIFHNDSISDYGEWKGWKQVYEKLIDELND
ncbi:MAG: polysaccharide deacetylase family protein [Flavobacteriaceae bacterium]|jgi:hypothetical protein|nr:polysaccharide deacetylase family protein [Flavobacteriaceae bacterium]